MDTRPLAYSYLRFSTPEQMKGDSYRRQTELAAHYAEKHGLRLDDKLRLHDEGVSAFRAKNVRQGALGRFLRLIDDEMVEEGSFLLVESLDRVSRTSPWDAMPVFMSIINAGLTIVTLQDGRTWNREQLRENPFRIMESLMVMIRANEESEVKSRRLREVWKAKRSTASTRPLTSQVPAWLSLDKSTGLFVVDEEKAAVIRRIYRAALDGTGLHKIAETLNREGVPCFGKARYWHKSYVMKLLNSEAPIGTFVPHEIVHREDGGRIRKPKEPVVGYFPAVVDHDLYQGVRLMRSGVRLPTVREGHTVSSVFAGLAKCPVCSGTMTRVSKGPKRGGKPYLVCQAAKVGAGCKYRAVPLLQIEDALADRVDEFLSDAPSGDAELDETYEELIASIGACEEEIENLARTIAYAPSPALSAKLREVENERDELRQELATVRERLAAMSAGATQRIKQALASALKAKPLDRSEANRCLRTLLSGVVVDYDSGTVTAQWKQGTETEFVYDYSAYFPPIAGGWEYMP